MLQFYVLLHNVLIIMKSLSCLIFSEKEWFLDFYYFFLNWQTVTAAVPAICFTYYSPKTTFFKINTVPHDHLFKLPMFKLHASVQHRSNVLLYLKGEQTYVPTGLPVAGLRTPVKG
jgi:hypothetical protein